MSDEVTFTGGSLGFLKKKKKKKKSKKKRKLEEADVEEQQQDGGAEGEKKKVAFSSRDEDRDEDEDPPPTTTSPNSDSEDDDLTDFERAHIRKKRAKEARDTAALAEKSHRERVDEFNQGLSTLTEHNDLPRISAAGNG